MKVDNVKEKGRVMVTNLPIAILLNIGLLVAVPAAIIYIVTRNW